jgi:hypothetical protein
MRVAVLGGGFGLYGYLPALVSIGHTVVLPQRYRPTIDARAELQGFVDGIDWQADDGAALDRASAVVLARRPEDQLRLLPGILARPQIEQLILEKPLARDPAEAARLQAELADSGKAFRVGYTFPLTGWGQRLIANAGSIVHDEISMAWRFRAHHYATRTQTWKRLHSRGGGALRFYGIQIIGLLAQLGYDTALSSDAISSAPDEIEAWTAVFSGADGAVCRVTIESNADHSEFSVKTASPDTSVRLGDPFDEQRGPQDRRVPLLAVLCGDALSGREQFCNWYPTAISLWRQMEQMTVCRSA